MTGAREMRIGEFAAAAGVTTRTIRHYEQLGLLQPSERTASGYRYYTGRELARFKKISQLQSLGLTLEEIATVIDLYFDDPSGVQGKRKVLGILEGHLRETRRRRGELERFESELEKSVEKVRRLLAEAERSSS